MIAFESCGITSPADSRVDLEAWDCSACPASPSQFSSMPLTNGSAATAWPSRELQNGSGAISLVREEECHPLYYLRIWCSDLWPWVSCLGGGQECMGAIPQTVLEGTPIHEPNSRLRRLF